MQRKIAKWFHTTIKVTKLIANYIGAAMLLVIFLAFCINVILRYTLGISFGWIVEFSLILWLWVVFLGAGIFLENDDHVSLVYMYRAFHKKIRLSLKAFACSVIFFGGFFMIAPVWDYVDFLKIRYSDVIGIPMNNIFSVYKIFLISLILRYGYLVLGYVRELFYVEDTEDHTRSEPPAGQGYE